MVTMDPVRIVTQVVAVPARARRLGERLARDLDEVEALIRRVDRTLDAVAAVVDSAAGVTADAAARTDAAGAVIGRLQRLVDLYEPPLRALAPALVDLVPRVLDKVEPALRNLANLAPNLEQVTERVDNVGQIVEGLPGARLLQRRGQAKEEDPAEG
jgi:ABC-type transporter Mla subunit MlaD